MINYYATLLIVLMFLLSGINHVVGMFCGGACDATPLSRLLGAKPTSGMVKGLLGAAGLLEVAGALLVASTGDLARTSASARAAPRARQRAGAWLLLAFTILVTLLFKVPRLWNDAFSSLYARAIPLLSNVSVAGGLLAIALDQSQ
jgi:hypothetical protein